MTSAAPLTFKNGFISVLYHLLFQQSIIYYLCILLKDSSNPEAVSSVVPLFQVSFAEDY